MPSVGSVGLCGNAMAAGSQAECGYHPSRPVVFPTPARRSGFPDGAGGCRAAMMGGMGTSADAREAPYLPEPTGPCPVGTTSLYLKDAARPDPWAAGMSVRELMVTLWYPAAPSDGPRARYMTPAESGLQLTGRGITGVPPDVLSTVRTNAVSDATPGRAAPRPAPRRALTLTRATPRPSPTGGSPPASPAGHPAEARSSGRRWWQAGPPTSRSCSAS
jgi:hypothetical protein